MYEDIMGRMPGMTVAVKEIIAPGNITGPASADHQYAQRASLAAIRGIVLHVSAEYDLDCFGCQCRFMSVLFRFSDELGDTRIADPEVGVRSATGRHLTLQRAA